MCSHFSSRWASALLELSFIFTFSSLPISLVFFMFITEALNICYISLVKLILFQFSSVAQLCLTLVTHGLQHSGPPCPSPTLGPCANSCPLSWWHHPTISSSVIPFSSCLQSFPESGSYPMSWLFCIRWPKYWSFNFNISSSNEYSGLISFRIDWFDLFAFQGTLKSLLQHHGSKSSVLRLLAFFIVQLSHPHMTTGKTIALTRWTFVSKVIFQVFNTLSKFVIAFLFFNC